jgi:hypothetical protein
MTCAGGDRAPFRCPTEPEILRGIFALLPRGRAWQTHEGGPEQPIDRAFDPEVFQGDAFATRYKKGSILYRFWAAFAAVLAFVNERLCALRLEFWCATHSETHDLWMEEYGLPDACDPFPDLCIKVAAIGGTRCEYYAEIAARAGWSIACRDVSSRCGGALTGRARVGGAGARTGGMHQLANLQIDVFLNESRAFSGVRTRRALTGRLRCGQRLACEASIEPLKCVLERAVHAHIPIIYRTI